MVRKNKRAQEIQEARRLLRLHSRASLQDIKDAYRELARECHPDQKPAEEKEQWEERLREINAAYDLLMDYCARYTFSFDPEIVEEQCRKQDPMEYWKNQFVD